MKKILLAGFDPFGEEEVNPATEAVKCMNEKLSKIMWFPR